MPGSKLRQRRRVRLAVASVAATALVLCSAPASQAGPIESYCSPQTGDFCIVVAKRDGRIKLELATFSFRGYTLCVRGPADKTCIDRQLRDDGQGLFTDRVDFERKFGSQGPGRYKAVWKVEGGRIGPALAFHP